MPDSSANRPRDRRRDDLLWLETYFIVFPKQRRPTLSQVERVLAEAGPHFRLANLAADDQGLFQSLLVDSPEDHAAVEISFECGEEIFQQNIEWAKQFQQQLSPRQLQRLGVADARLDVAHFERVEHGAARSSAPSAGHSAEPERARRDDDAWSDDEDSAADVGDDFGVEEFDAEQAYEIVDPTCVLTVVEALAKLTKGVTIDAASGEVL